MDNTDSELAFQIHFLTNKTTYDISREIITVGFNFTPKETDVPYYRHSVVGTVVLSTVYILLLIFGAASNLCVLCVLTRLTNRTVANLFIRHLAAADLLVITFCVPSTLVTNLVTPWLLGRFMCKAVAYLQGVSVFSSAYLLVAISADRYKALQPPVTLPSEGFNKREAHFVLALIWIVALLLFLPWVVTFDEKQVLTEDQFVYCLESWENSHHATIYFLVVNCFFCFILPAFLIGLFNFQVWRKVTTRQLPPHLASAAAIEQMHSDARKGAKRILIAFSLVFSLFWLPLYGIVFYIKIFAPETSDIITKILLPAAQFLGSANSCLNPVFYAFINRRIRERIKGYFKCFKWKNFSRKIFRPTAGSILLAIESGQLFGENFSASQNNYTLICNEDAPCNEELEPNTACIQESLALLTRDTGCQPVLKVKAQYKALPTVQHIKIANL